MHAGFQTQYTYCGIFLKERTHFGFAGVYDSIEDGAKVEFDQPLKPLPFSPLFFPLNVQIS